MIEFYEFENVVKQLRTTFKKLRGKKGTKTNHTCFKTTHVFSLNFNISSKNDENFNLLTEAIKLFLM